jgi:hypothetical protein
MPPALIFPKAPYLPSKSREGKALSDLILIVKQTAL